MLALLCNIFPVFWICALFIASSRVATFISGNLLAAAPNEQQKAGAILAPLVVKTAQGAQGNDAAIHGAAGGAGCLSQLAIAPAGAVARRVL